jgi:CheY-like chemotaxis protein
MDKQRPVNIVMIEDDEGHARLIEKNIRRAGISNQIHHFVDGTSALAFLLDGAEGPTHNGPALVLLDLNLPDMSGIDILARIKGRKARCGGPRSSCSPPPTTRWKSSAATIWAAMSTSPSR